MAIDEGLLERAMDTGFRTPVVRIYRWSKPALSVGAHQLISEELTDRCRRHGVEVVRRATGGSAVVHGKDITYSVVAPHGSMGVMEAYRWVAEGLIAGLRHLGAEARVAERCRHPGLPAPARLDSSTACFASMVGADLEIDGAKICGSAQVRRRGWFLQHGSIPISDDRPLTRKLLRHSSPNRSTYLDSVRPGISWDEVAACLVRGFSDVWGPYRETTPELVFGEPSDASNVLS